MEEENIIDEELLNDCLMPIEEFGQRLSDIESVRRAEILSLCFKLRYYLENSDN